MSIRRTQVMILLSTIVVMATVPSVLGRQGSAAQQQRDAGAGRLEFPLTSSTYQYERDLGAGLRLVLRSERDGYGWVISVDRASDRRQVLLPSCPGHGPCWTHLFAWHQGTAYDSGDERHFWIEFPPTEIVTRFVGAKRGRSQDGSEAIFTAGTLVVTWRPVKSIPPGLRGATQ
jgi:hypothetical protein